MEQRRLRQEAQEERDRLHEEGRVRRGGQGPDRRGRSSGRRGPRIFHRR